MVQALVKLGYARDRQKGSHIVLRRAEAPFRRIVIPDHNQIAKGMLRSIIKHSGLTVDEFKALL